MEPEVSLQRAVICGVEVLYSAAVSDGAPAESARLWPLTERLARFLLDTYPPKDGLQGRTVLELGAGTAALSAFVAKAYPHAACVATDLPAVLPTMRATVAANHGGNSILQAKALAWGASMATVTPAGVHLVLCCEPVLGRLEPAPRRHQRAAPADFARCAGRHCSAPRLHCARRGSGNHLPARLIEALRRMRLCARHHAVAERTGGR